EVDGHAAAAFLGPAVRFHPGEGAHQGGLAVVDVAGGGYDVHARSTAAARASSASSGTQRRSSRSRPRSTRPTTAGVPVRSLAAYVPGSASDHDASVTSGAPPPPTTATDSTSSTSTPLAASRAR